MSLEHVRAAARKVIPATAHRGLANAWWLCIYPGLQFLAARRQAHFAGVRSFRDRHQGERCFIIGNGPSLKRMDLSPLRDEYTFGLNRIYLLFPEIGFPTSFLVCMNRHVIEQFHDEIEALPMPKFFPWTARDVVSDSDSVSLLWRHPIGLRFSKSVAFGVWEGATVTFVAMQLAFYMGFSKVILIGVDHSFQTRGPAHKLITSDGDDENHFAPNYFGRGVKWQLPDLETSEIAYGLARDTFAAAGRELVDATVGGNLQVFPKVRYEELF